MNRLFSRGEAVTDERTGVAGVFDIPVDILSGGRAGGVISPLWGVTSPL